MPRRSLVARACGNQKAGLEKGWPRSCHGARPETDGQNIGAAEKPGDYIPPPNPSINPTGSIGPQLPTP